MFYAKSSVISLLSFFIIIFHCLVLVSASLICRRIPNLTTQQLKICEQSPEILPVVSAGIQLALNECQQLFHYKAKVHAAWNCSTWIDQSLNRLFVDIKDPDVIGTKEASLAYALFSAGVTYALSEACTKGNFPYCTCDKVSPKGKLPKNNAQNVEWKWQTCGHNVQFGSSTARRFLDSVEHNKMSPYSLLNLHNNKVGRRAIKESVIKRCQCHGFSGACTFRTCWHEISSFRETTQNLYLRYETAKIVSYNWMMDKYKARFSDKKRSGSQQAQKLINGIVNLTQFQYNQPNPNRNDDITEEVRNRDLVYLKSSVNYCRLTKRSPQKNVSCVLRHNHTLNVENQQSWPPSPSCNSVCCGRGMRPRTVLKKAKCDCQFKFCCQIECKMCTKLVTVYDCSDE